MHLKLHKTKINKFFTANISYSHTWESSQIDSTNCPQKGYILNNTKRTINAALLNLLQGSVSFLWLRQDLNFQNIATSDVQTTNYYN